MEVLSCTKSVFVSQDLWLGDPLGEVERLASQNCYLSLSLLELRCKFDLHLLKQEKEMTPFNIDASKKMLNDEKQWTCAHSRTPAFHISLKNHVSRADLHHLRNKSNTLGVFVALCKKPTRRFTEVSPSFTKAASICCAPSMKQTNAWYDLDFVISTVRTF